MFLVSNCLKIAFSIKEPAVHFSVVWLIILYCVIKTTFGEIGLYCACYTVGRAVPINLVYNQCTFFYNFCCLKI